MGEVKQLPARTSRKRRIGNPVTRDQAADSSRGDRRSSFAQRDSGEAFKRPTDPEDLMHKATGWLLREAGRTDAGRLRRFLLKHGPAEHALKNYPVRLDGRLLEIDIAEGTRS